MTFRNFGVMLSARCGLSVVGLNKSGVPLLQPLFKRASILPECRIKAASTLSSSVDLFLRASPVVRRWQAACDLTLLLVLLVSKAPVFSMLLWAASSADPPNLWLNDLLTPEQMRSQPTVWLLLSCAWQQRTQDRQAAREILAPSV